MHPGPFWKEEHPNPLGEFIETIMTEFPEALRADIEAVVEAVARDFPLATKEEFLRHAREILKLDAGPPEALDRWP